MSGLHDSIQASREEKKKKLLELQAKKKSAAESTNKKIEENKTPRTSRLPDTSIDKIMQEVLKSSAPNPIPVAEEVSKPVYKPNLVNSGAFLSVSIKGRAKTKVVEFEVQVDLPKEPKQKEKVEEVPVAKIAPQESKEVEKKEEPEEDLSEKLLRSSEMHGFLEKSSRLIERALGQEDQELYTPVQKDFKTLINFSSRSKIHSLFL